MSGLITNSFERARLIFSLWIYLFFLTIKNQLYYPITKSIGLVDKSDSPGSTPHPHAHNQYCWQRRSGQGKYKDRIRRNKDRSANKKWHNAHNSHLLYILGRIIIIKQVLKEEAKQILNLLEDTISREFHLESRIKVITRRKVLLPFL